MPDAPFISNLVRRSSYRSWGRRALSGGVGLTLGWGLWWASGAAAIPPYSAFGLGLYLGGAALAGLLATLPAPRTPWLGAVGVWLGQVAYIAVVYVPALPPDPMIFAPFAMVLFFGAVPPMIGAVPVPLTVRT